MLYYVTKSCKRCINAEAYLSFYTLFIHALILIVTLLTVVKAVSSKLCSLIYLNVISLLVLHLFLLRNSFYIVIGFFLYKCVL
jgi:hypothetical protein